MTQPVEGPTPPEGDASRPAGVTTHVPHSTSAVGAYSQREFQFVEREARGELSFKYIYNDGEPQNLEWCAWWSMQLTAAQQPTAHQRRSP
jgi:hypothetical protein